MTVNVSFVGDALSRKVTRLLLLLQIVAMLIVVGLSLAHFLFLAFALSVLSLLMLSFTLLWLYARYREIPAVREKRELERLRLKFQKGVQTEEKNIQDAVKERARLVQAEKEEINIALETLRRKHIENGLRMASIQEAAISGVGPKLKERLAGDDILSAADITEQVMKLPGLEETERQALMDWRRSVLEKLESTQPSGLPQKQLEAIQQKAQALRAQNDMKDRNARSSQQMLEYELISFRERLKQLAPFTFPRYLSRSLASRGTVAAPLAFALIVTQVVSSVSATTASIIFWIPATTPSPTSMPARRATNTITHPSATAVAAMQTTTPLQTSTFPATSFPTETAASTATQPPTRTLTPTATWTPFPTLTIPPSNTAIIPVSGGETNGSCDPSYPGVCIAPAPPDLDCNDVPYRRFQVLPPDPHNFDRDGDGIGCES